MGNRRAKWPVLYAATAAFLVWGSLAHPQSAARAELERIEREQAQAKARLDALRTDANTARQQAKDFQDRLIAASNAREALEQEVVSRESRLLSLNRRQAAARARLENESEALEDVVVALIAMQRDRPPALAVRPQNAAEAARASILMGLVAPQLDQRAADLRKRLQGLADIRRAILMENTAYREATENLAKARREMGDLIAENRARADIYEQRAGQEQAFIDRRAARAADLRELILRLGETLPQLGQSDAMPILVGDITTMRGKLQPPVIGQTIARFGSRDSAGVLTNGLVIRARSGAQVRSPCDGRVEYVGPFRTFGQVAIINAGKDHYVVLAGLGATFAETGQNVLSGEPIPEMAADGNQPADLYFEIRANGMAIDPQTWLAR